MSASSAPTASAACLIARIKALDGLLIAHSGGLDSSLLVHTAGLAGIRALAVTGYSATTPAEDLKDAQEIAASAGVPHRVVESREMEVEGFVANSPQRCYHCKDALFLQLTEIASAEGYSHIAYGANKSDLLDHRPGMRAASQHGILSPLIDCGLDKQGVRDLARQLGLKIHDKPASPCLSSRVPYGIKITPEALRRIASAEAALKEMLGLRDLRVRDQSGSARIELPDEPSMARAFEMRTEIVSRLMSLGYTSVLLDLEGMRSGKLNREIR